MAGRCGGSGVLPEAGSCQGRGIRGESVACQGCPKRGGDTLAGGTIPPDARPTRAAIRAANKPLTMSLLIGAG